MHNKNSSRWHLVALAFLALLFASNAAALTLGPAMVLSGVGQPLKAQIEVLQASPADMAGLKVNLMGEDAHKDSGLSFNPALVGVQLGFQRQDDGRVFLVLNGDRPINESNMDVVLEALWPSGRLLRAYNLLLNPGTPRPQVAPEIVNTPAQTAPAVAPVTRIGAEPTSRELDAAEKFETMPKRRSSKRRSSAKESGSVGLNRASDGQVRVHSGDTAGLLAAKYVPAKISVDQMLVALLKANPNAFSNGNVNRLKAGALLALPSAAQAASTSAADAHQMVVAQSKDFNEYRRQLAGHAPGVDKHNSAQRSSGGKVQARVEDKKSAAATADKLSLSKGDVKSANEIAKQKQTKETLTRQAELNKNVGELKKLAASGQKGSAGGVGATGTLSASTDGAGVAAPVASAASGAQTATGSGNDLSNIALPLAGLGVAGLLAWGFTRSRQRKQTEALHDSTLLTQSSTAAHDHHDAQSSFAEPYVSDTDSHGETQLESADKIDPMAQADIYLAYGRDAQAERVLKEVLQATPSRIAAHEKLLGIYAKREDAKAFAAAAHKLRDITRGQGDAWARACAMGRHLDPHASLYAATAAGLTGTAAPYVYPVAAAHEPQVAPLPQQAARMDSAHAKESGDSSPASPNHQPIDYDLSSLSLDLSPPEKSAPIGLSDEALVTKLALAKEFLSLGDSDGARALAHEVLAASSGTVKLQAQKMIANIEDGVLHG